MCYNGCMILKKACPRCQEVMASSYFNKDKTRSDGLTTYCKKCTKIRRDEYRNRDRERFNKMAAASSRRRRKEVYPLRPVVKTEKLCTNCGEVKGVDDFTRMPSASDGLHSWCHDCARYIAFVRKLKRSYNLTYQDYETMINDQDGRCAICFKEPTRFHVDHDHSTGKVRQLLCAQCNSGLGMFQDDPDVLLSAIEYLKKHSK